MSRAPALEIVPLSPTLGARVGGINLAQAMDAESVAGIRQALLKYEVLLFEDQHLTPGQHRDFAARCRAQAQASATGILARTSSCTCCPENSL